MGIKTFKVKFNSIGKQSSIRFDSKFRYFQDIKKAIVWQKNSLKKLKFILQPISCEKVKKGELEQEEYLIDLGNIERRHNFLINPQRILNIGSDKTIIRNGDLVLPKLEPKKGQFFLNLQHNRYLGSTELLEFKINQNLFKPLFLYYLLTHEAFLNCLGNLESGKTHKRVSGDDLLNIKIPLIPKLIQDQAVAKIKPIEDKIKELKAQIKDPIEMINKVFVREFKFDSGKFSKLKREKVFNVKLSFFNDYKLRCNFKSNNGYIKFLLSFIKNISLPLKEFLKDKIESGDMPKYNENGNYKVIKTINVNSKGFIEFFEDDKFILDTNKFLEKGDILATTHGEGRGKFGIYEKENKATTDANCSILKVNKGKINVLYLNYYLSSFFGKELFGYLESETKSVRYMKNDDLEQMPIIFNKTKQQKIINEIKTEIDKQEEIRKKIEKERKKIDEIINQCIK